MSAAELVSALGELGFSLNESRAYAALLQESPATGYEVGVRAQIPRSAVYGVLRRLERVGAARSIAGTPERFVPAPAAEVLAVLRKRFESSADHLDQAVRSLGAAPPAPEAFTVREYDRVLEEAERLVRLAKSRVVVSGWAREIDLLLPELRRAHKRGVYVVVFSHCALGKIPGEVHSYGLLENDLEAFWRHRLIVVRDDEETLVGATEKKEGDHAVISGTAAIAEVVTGQVALDITLLAQRSGKNVSPVMARMLGARVGRLDTLLGVRAAKKGR
jgi:HTH-type transcriptional regulator, sugar sensing transcriptional regulator